MGSTNIDDIYYKNIMTLAHNFTTCICLNIYDKLSYTTDNELKLNFMIFYNFIIKHLEIKNTQEDVEKSKKTLLEICDKNISNPEKYIDKLLSNSDNFDTIEYENMFLLFKEFFIKNLIVYFFQNLTKDNYKTDFYKYLKYLFFYVRNIYEITDIFSFKLFFKTDDLEDIYFKFNEYKEIGTSFEDKKYDIKEDDTDKDEKEEIIKKNKDNINLLFYNFFMYICIYYYNFIFLMLNKEHFKLFIEFINQQLDIKDDTTNNDKKKLYEDKSNEKITTKTLDKLIEKKYDEIDVTEKKEIILHFKHFFISSLIKLNFKNYMNKYKKITDDIYTSFYMNCFDNLHGKIFVKKIDDFIFFKSDVVIAQTTIVPIVPTTIVPTTIVPTTIVPTTIVPIVPTTVAEEKARKEAEEKARKEAEEKTRKEAEEKARKEAAEREKAIKDAENIDIKRAETNEILRTQEINAEKARKEAEEKARKEVEERARKESEERARKEAEERARKILEERARNEAEERARKEAEERERREVEERAKKEAEERAIKEAEERARKEAEERARKEAEEIKNIKDKIKNLVILDYCSGYLLRYNTKNVIEKVTLYCTKLYNLGLTTHSDFLYCKEDNQTKMDGIKNQILFIFELLTNIIKLRKEAIREYSDFQYYICELLFLAIKLIYCKKLYNDQDIIDKSIDFINLYNSIFELNFDYEKLNLQFTVRLYVLYGILLIFNENFHHKLINFVDIPVYNDKPDINITLVHDDSYIFSSNYEFIKEITKLYQELYKLYN